MVKASMKRLKLTTCGSWCIQLKATSTVMKMSLHTPAEGVLVAVLTEEVLVVVLPEEVYTVLP